MVKPKIIVGISGGSGSGKTSLLNSLLDVYSKDEICIVSQDNYYRPLKEQFVDENGEVNFDLPESIDIEKFVEDLNLLSSGKQIEKTEYTFNNNAKEAQTIVVNPAKILVIEGLFIFHFKMIMEKINLAVFVHTDRNLRLERRIKRDGKERGYPEATVIYQWENHVEPAFKSYLEPYKKDCHLTINNNESYQLGLMELKRILDNKLRK